MLLAATAIGAVGAGGVYALSRHTAAPPPKVDAPPVAAIATPPAPTPSSSQPVETPPPPPAPEIPPAQRAWQAAMETDTLSAYRDFLDAYAFEDAGITRAEFQARVRRRVDSFNHGGYWPNLSIRSCSLSKVPLPNAPTFAPDVSLRTPSDVLLLDINGQAWGAVPTKDDWPYRFFKRADCDLLVASPTENVAVGKPPKPKRTIENGVTWETQYYRSGYEIAQRRLLVTKPTSPQLRSTRTEAGSRFQKKAERALGSSRSRTRSAMLRVSFTVPTVMWSNSFSAANVKFLGIEPADTPDALKKAVIDTLGDLDFTPGRNDVGYVVDKPMTMTFCYLGQGPAPAACTPDGQRD